MELLRVRYDEQARGERRKQASLAIESAAVTLKPWREVVTPHQDVASGRYQQAEFAADRSPANSPNRSGAGSACRSIRINMWSGSRPTSAFFRPFGFTGRRNHSRAWSPATLNGPPFVSPMNATPGSIP